MSKLYENMMGGVQSFIFILVNFQEIEQHSD